MDESLQRKSEGQLNMKKKLILIRKKNRISQLKKKIYDNDKTAKEAKMEDSRSHSSFLGKEEEEESKSGKKSGPTSSGQSLSEA